MKKVLLSLLAFFVAVPFIAFADNQALNKASFPNYSNNEKTDTRLIVPYDAIGYGALKATGASDKSTEADYN